MELWQTENGIIQKATKPTTETDTLSHVKTLLRHKTIQRNQKPTTCQGKTRTPKHQLNDGLHPHSRIWWRKPKLPPRNSQRRERSRWTNRQRMDIHLHNTTKNNDVQKTQMTPSFFLLANIARWTEKAHWTHIFETHPFYNGLDKWAKQIIELGIGTEISR